MKRPDLMYMIELKIGGKVKLSLFTNNRILYVENPKGNTHTYTQTVRTKEKKINSTRS